MEHYMALLAEGGALATGSIAPALISAIDRDM
jgi:hypothetical protein